MQKLDLTTLVSGDIILAECHIVRDERFDGKSLDPGIEARLELQSMSRFASRMEAVDENTADLFPFTF